MDKILIIIQREYTSRVFKKSFLLVTLLTPIGIGLIMFLAGYLTSKGSKTNKSILVVDETQHLKIDSIKSSTYTFSKSDKPIDSLKKSYVENGYDLLIHSSSQRDSSGNKYNLQYYSKEKLSILEIEKLESVFRREYERYALENSPLDKTLLKNLEVDIDLENAMLSKDNKDNEDAVGDKSSKFSSAIATGLSYGMGFLMYMVIFIFGSMVMRSVMEEKINRIVEVMISSVKPFQLMMGKVIGVGLVGLTQLSVWIILMAVMFPILSSQFGGDALASQAAGTEALEAAKQMGDDNKMALFISEFNNVNWSYILPVFVIYFFGGYFIYSTLFAAVGSATGDDIGDTQQLMIPLTIPIILGFSLIGSVISNPNGPIAIFGSMFPLLSPILMPARLPFEPPIWQVALSVLFLILGILFFTWLAGRIYRIGILMYGKKVGFKEIGKWIMTKD